MSLVRKLAALALGLIVVVWLVFSWFEADKEIGALCSTFHAGMEHEHVVRMLETGEYLRFRTEADTANEPAILVDSLYNLRSSSCVIEFEAGRMVSSIYTSGL